MQSESDLEASIKAQFPLMFGTKEMVSTADFYQAYNAIAEHSIKAADPALKSETHKHQWTLAGASIGLIALILFKVGKIKIAEALVVIDQQVLIWYAVFVAALLLTFMLRAALDLKRASLARKKDSEKLLTLSELVEMAWARKNIQQYYWLELFHQIGERYAAYHDAAASTSNAEPFEQPDTRVLKLDIASLRKLEEFGSQIELHESFVASLLKDLDRDVERFKDEVMEYDSPPRQNATLAGGSRWARYKKVQELFDQNLKRWFDARNSMADAALDAAIDKRSKRESQMLDAQLQLLRQAQSIRRLYAFLEIALPAALALTSVVYAIRTVLPEGG